MLQLQSPIRCYDEPLAGRLAGQSVDILREYAHLPHGSARRARDTAPRCRPRRPWADRKVWSNADGASEQYGQYSESFPLNLALTIQFQDYWFLIFAVA